MEEKERFEVFGKHHIKEKNNGNEIALKPTYWASVSGGKDSLYMLYYILNHLDKYPLDGVCHFELEIDYPFLKMLLTIWKASAKSII